MLVDKLRWGIEQRLAFIESRIFWDGSVNRADLMGAFDISVPQASKDLSLYQERAPGNLVYDRARKRYVPTDGFAPRFAKLDPDTYLRNLADLLEGLAPTPNRVAAERLPIPRRNVDRGVLRHLVAAAREGHSLEILYQSTSPASPGQLKRRVSPHAFVDDGTRWHMRAYCHREEKFLDFILSRCLAAEAASPTAISPLEDQAWNERFAVILCPNPRMTETQQQVARDDYGMVEGQIVVEVRRALLFHFSKRLRLDTADMGRPPNETPVVVKNRADFDQAMAAAYGRPD